MNLDFDLSSDETELRITAAGRLDDDALVEAYRRFWERSGRPPLRRMLSDLPAVEGPGLSTQTIRRLADENQQVLGGLRAQLRSAIVASDDLHFGLARMHAAYTETALPLLVTRDIAEAEAWIRKSAPAAPAPEDVARSDDGFVASI